MKAKAKRQRRPRPASPRRPTIQRFMFATGIENSYPVITGKDGQDVRMDELALCRTYEHWREDFHLTHDLGLRFLRYGPPYYKVHQGPGRYDWDFTDETFAELKRLGITPIADLCHFGVPDWIGNFQNDDWPELYAQYAEAFARRFPWVIYYTPVNEIFVCASFSALNGWWNERLKSDRAFVRALKNLCRAALLAEEAILRVQPQALFIQSEATVYFHAEEPAAKQRADVLNQRRFLSLDLLYGHDVQGCMYEYLTDNGLSRDDYHWFLDKGHALKPHCIMGNDYYVSNEHLVPPGDGAPGPSGEIFGYYVITHQYYERYHLPVMHTETNLGDAEKAPQWLRKEWSNMLRLRDDGVPIIGFTWYSLIDQVDWDTALREDNGHVNPCGLYDLDRKPRPVGEAYRQLVNRWRDILQSESMSFNMHLPMES
jgi:beta-glucosidase/6-phospho-beta-glucosidase/beta-galactosidase